PNGFPTRIVTDESGSDGLPVRLLRAGGFRRAYQRAGPTEPGRSHANDHCQCRTAETVADGARMAAPDVREVVRLHPPSSPLTRSIAARLLESDSHSYSTPCPLVVPRPGGLIDSSRRSGISQPMPTAATLPRGARPG